MPTHKPHDSDVAVAALPPYQPQIANLNPMARQTLTQLSQSPNIKRLHHHIRTAGTLITQSAGTVTDELVRAQERHRKTEQRVHSQQARAGSAGSGGGSGGAGDNDSQQEQEQEQEQQEEERPEQREQWRHQEHELVASMAHVDELQRQVDAATAELERAMRQMVDDERWVDEMTRLVDDTAQTLEQRVPEEEEEGAGEEDGDNAGNAGNGDDGGGDRKSKPAKHKSAVVTPAHEMVAGGLDESMAGWNAKSLTDRYAKSNDYIGFYRVFHDAKHQCEESAPPVPHPSTWFAHLEGEGNDNGDGDDGSGNGNRNGNAGRTGIRRAGGPRASSPALLSDADVAIAGERISTKCPLTLLTFKNPLTSTRCPHSFEASAILDMIARSRDTATVSTSQGGGRTGGGSGPRRRCIRCPVCDVRITADDLKPDPVLARKVQRAVERTQEDDEEEEEEEEEEGGQGYVAYSSQQKGSRGKNTGAIKQIKQERIANEAASLPASQMSRVPDTQLGDDDEDSSG